MRPNRLVFIRLVAVGLSLSMLLACRADSTATNSTNSATVTPPNAVSPTASQTNGNAPAGNANAPVAAATPSPGCGDCWVHIFDDKALDTTDDNHIICGPGKWATLSSLPGAVKLNWGDEIESFKVGPSATVIVWVGEQFTGITQTFGPGTQKVTLKGNPDLSDEVSSIEIRCQ
jgi:hypothetical protein